MLSSPIGCFVILVYVVLDGNTDCSLFTVTDVTSLGVTVLLLLSGKVATGRSDILVELSAFLGAV